MKVRSLCWAATTAILAIVVSASSRAEEKADFSQHAFDAKVTYCKTCHGVSGQGFRGTVPIPRLAGQQPQYIKNQLGAFIERRRDNKYMYNVGVTVYQGKVFAEPFRSHGSRDNSPNTLRIN